MMLSGHRLLKWIVVASVAFAISVQFRAAFVTLQSELRYLDGAEFEPPGSRRWGAAEDEEARRPVEEPAPTAATDSVAKTEEGSADGHEDRSGKDEGEGAKPTPRSDELQGEPSGQVVDETKGVEASDDPAVTETNQKGADAPVGERGKVEDEDTKPKPPQSRSGDDSQRLQRPGSKLHEPARLSPSRRVPRVVATAPSTPTDAQPNATARVDFEETSMPADGPRVQPDWYDPNAEEFVDGYDWDVCVPMYDWQLQSFPSCNSFHELDYSKLHLIGSGGSRWAYTLTQEVDGKENKFVYKTVKYYKDLTMKLVEEQRRDAMVLERTTKSQFIPDIHGYCGVGVMMDYMPEGNFLAYMKGVRLAGHNPLPPVDKLRIAIHIATSVADLHTIDDTPIPSLFDNDICCHQYLFQNGVFKLNDFNYARPIYINKNTKEGCTRWSFGMAMWKGRSLEEMQNKLSKTISVNPDKMDVWMMGNVIYYALTDLYTFEKPRNLSWQESGRELLAGRRSAYPEDIEKSEDPSYVAMKKALDMCWTQNWKERPTARSISDYLWQQLREITGEKDPDVRVTLPERDPNQQNTESDYDKYND